jgi:hypothetical protein
MSKRTFSLAALALAFGLLYFPARFALTFQLFGNAVHSPSNGWLGPTPRDAGKCVVDAGKVNIWQCTDATVFAEHRVGCRLWLHVFGYSGA